MFPELPAKISTNSPEMQPNVIGNSILKRGAEEVNYNVTDFAVIRIDITIDGVPKICWLFNRDSESQKGLIWLPSINGQISTSKHRLFGNFLLKNRFSEAVFNGKPVIVHNISYYGPEVTDRKFDAVYGTIEVSATNHLKFQSLSKFLKYLSDTSNITNSDFVAQPPPRNISSIEEGVLDGTQRYIRDTIALRISPALDKEQTRIKEANVFDGLLIIDGGPGTGKTTTLIQRINFLTQKLALQDYKQDIPAAILNEIEGEKGWLFISPSELLKAYLQNAMTEEGLKAGNSKMKVWRDHLDELFRAYHLFQADGSRKSPFTKSRKSDSGIFPNDWTTLELFFNLFDEYSVNRIKAMALRDSPSLDDKDLNLLRQKISVSLKGLQKVKTWIELYQALTSQSNEYGEELQQISKELNELLNQDTNGLVTELINNHQQLYVELENWAKISKADDDDEDDEEGQEEQEDGLVASNRARLLKKLKSLVRHHAMISLHKGHSVSALQKTWISKLENIFSKTNTHKIGESAILLKSYRRWGLKAESQLLNTVPNAYKEFRRDLIANKFPSNTKIARGLAVIMESGNDKLHYEEMNFLFAWINRKIKLIGGRFNSRLQDSTHKYLEAYALNFRYNVVVDEATDFSLVELVAMESLTHYQFKSMTVCGDLMQRLTRGGLGDWTPLLESVNGQGKVHELRVSYRQTPTLLALASGIYLQVTGKPASYIPYLKRSPDEPKPWVMKCEDNEELSSWLSKRIIEIHNAYRGKTPSIAIFCHSDEKVRSLTEVLKMDDSLFEIGINIQAVESHTALVNASKVCVYNIRDIKGLEFEAVFFVDVDELENFDEELMQKYIYVGLSRAAYYLGISFVRSLPKSIQKVLYYE